MGLHRKHGAMRRALLGLLFTVGCGSATTAPQPGPLKAGISTLPLDAPIGISMGGYSRHKSATDRGSPFAATFDASTGIHVLPTARALALDDGLKQVVIVRIDTALVTETLQLRAQLHLASPSATLIVVATHTHAGAARFFRPAPISGDSFDVTATAMDTYDPELEDRMAVSIALAARQALASMQPVAVGHGEADAGVLNSDRRCQNDDLYGPDYRDRTVRVVRFDTVDAMGNPVAPLAGLLNFAVHGTILDPGNTLLSSEAPGALERASSQLLGVPMLYLQGTAGDVSPTTGVFGQTQAIERFGILGAPSVAEAFKAAAPTRASVHAQLQLTTRGISTLPQNEGYAQGEFPEWGAIDCGLGDNDCNQVLTPQTEICLPLSNTGVNQEPISALRVEDVLMVLLPGEPLTAIGQRVRDAAAAATIDGVNTTLVVGYTQDHAGYLLEEPDYLRGGYEPSVSPWGWKFGDYMDAQVKLMLASLGTEQPSYTPLPGFPINTHRIVEDSIGAAAVMQSPADLERLSTATLTFNGGDPSLGTPIVSLEVSQNGSFAAAPPDLIVLHEQSTPSFADDPDAGTRVHAYTAQWETVPTTPLGTYRLAVDGKTQLGGQVSTYHLESSAFALTASTEAGANATATMSSTGALGVQVRFPPNPTLFGAPDDPIGNYRLRDIDSSATDGALARGGQVAATLTAPDATTSQVMLVWSDDALAFGATVTPQTGHWAIDIAAGGVVDAAGKHERPGPAHRHEPVARCALRISAPTPGVHSPPMRPLVALTVAAAALSLSGCQCANDLTVGDAGKGTGGGSSNTDGGNRLSDGGTGAGGGSATGDTLVFNPMEATVSRTGAAAPANTVMFQLMLKHADNTMDPVSADQVFFDRPDLATLTAGSPVVATVNTAFAGTGTINALHGTLHASALLHVHQLVTSADPSIPMTVITALNQPNLPADTGVTSLLYPYDHTVFPLGLASPLIMWNAVTAGDTYLLRMKRSSYELDTYLVGATPGQIRGEQDLWDAITTSDDPSDPLVVTLIRYDLGTSTAAVSTTQSWTISNKSLRGTIYYWTTSGTGHMARIRPGSGSLPETLAGGQCMGCHAVSADGTKLVAAVEAAPSNDSSADTARAWVALDLPNADAGVTSTLFGGVLAINPDGKYVVYGTVPLRLGDSATGLRIPDSGIEDLPLDTGMATYAHPAFSPDGKHLAMVQSSSVWFEWQASRLVMSDFDEAAVKVTNPNIIARSEQFAATQQAIAYPTFTPDSQWVAFHVGDYASECTGSCDANEPGIASLYLESTDGGVPIALAQLNDSSLLMADHNSSFEPTFNPVENGGYFWLVFTSMRDWGNHLQGAPISGKKRLWVAAIDMTTGTTDPSHPAFYLEGQEETMNMRGFWTLSACTATAPTSVCSAGFECCSGFCANGHCIDPGPVVCKQQGELCSTTADCCSAGAFICDSTGTCAPGIN